MYPHSAVYGLLSYRLSGSASAGQEVEKALQADMQSVKLSGNIFEIWQDITITEAAYML